MFFNSITRELTKQINENNLKNEVEILFYCDNREKTTGHKRNVLIKQANGVFVVFLDDDDKISPNYVKLIVEAIKNNPEVDAIGIRGEYTENGRAPEPFETSLDHNWEKVNGWYYRTINHISPIRKVHAETVKFKDITLGEDYDWTMRLKETGLLKKEVVIQEPIYFYNFISNKAY